MNGFTAKTLVRSWGLLQAVPHLAAYRISRPIMGADRAFIAASERIARVPGYVGVHARQAYYRRVLERVGEDVYFGFMSVFSKAQATIGDRVYIGRFCSIGWAELGDQVKLADGVQILSGRYQHGSVSTDGGALRENVQQFDKVRIGAGAWIGAGAIVMADVGRRAIVAAGAVVTQPVAEAASVAGVPARKIEQTALRITSE